MRQQTLADGSFEKFRKKTRKELFLDATVPPSTLIRVLFDHLGDRGHQLVLFDVDRRAETRALLVHDPQQHLEDLIGETNKTYDLTLVTNKYLRFSFR